jgi:hypothetical protein
LYALYDFGITPKRFALAILDQRPLSGKGFRAGEIGLPYGDEGCQSLGSARLKSAG